MHYAGSYIVTHKTSQNLKSHNFMKGKGELDRYKKAKHIFLIKVVHITYRTVLIKTVPLVATNIHLQSGYYYF